MRRAIIALCATFFLASPSLCQPLAPVWSPRPWLDDLAAIRAAIETKYANRAWLADVRGIDADASFKQAAGEIAAAGNDATARSIIERTLRRFHDGHVEIEWPSGASGAAASSPPSACAALGFELRGSAGVGTGLPGYAPLPDDGVFPAGVVRVGGVKVGIVRIAEFQPQGAPALCLTAEQALSIADDSPCDEICQNRLMDAIYADFTQRFAARLRELRSAGARALVIDITNNGGGSEWAEAAARMLSPRPLTSQAFGFVRGQHWARHWRAVAEELQGYLAGAGAGDRAMLRRWIGEARAAERAALTPCVLGSGCTWLGRAGYATGLVGTAPAGAFRGKPWATTVFSPAQYDYQDGVWRGPLIVLVNDETWSAAEEFAAVLQDNGAAVIVGGRTGGAGCGHTDGGAPTTLPASGGVLQLPDCARLRRDGSNEINGVIPDLLVPWRYYDSPARAAQLLLPCCRKRSIGLGRGARSSREQRAARGVSRSASQLVTIPDCGLRPDVVRIEAPRMCRSKACWSPKVH